MRNLNVITVVAALSSLFVTSGAEAFICARGPARAGCVGRYGAVGVRRGPFVRRAVVVRRPVRQGVVVVR